LKRLEHAPDGPRGRKLLIGADISINQPVAKRGRFEPENRMPPVHRHPRVEPSIRRPKNPGARGQPHEQFSHPSALRWPRRNLALAILASSLFHTPAPETSFGRAPDTNGT